MSHQQVDGASEEWRPVPGFEGSYEVSNLGRVRSLDRLVQHAACTRHAAYSHIRRGIVLRPGPTKSGHLTVMLGRDGGTRFVHALVLLAFIGPPPPGLETRHLNGNEQDNRLSNLAYGTRGENTKDKKDHKGAVTYKLNTPRIKEIKARLARPYLGIGRDLAQEFGVAQSTISAIRRGRLHALTF